MRPDGRSKRERTTDGVVKKAGVADIYGAVLGYLNKIAPGHVYFLPCPIDLRRKSPLIAKEALGVLVDEILKKTHAKRVVLVGHSMGQALWMESFISEPHECRKGRAPHNARYALLGRGSSPTSRC